MSKFQEAAKAIRLRDSTDECANVRAVLNAILEPSAVMVDRAYHELGFDISRHDIITIYMSMINEILMPLDA